MKAITVFIVSLVLVLSLSSGANARVASSTSIPISIVVFVPCANGGAGELVTLSGNLHVVFNFEINGNNVSGKEHYQPQDLTGVGSVTGDKYQATGVTQGDFKASLQNGQFQTDFVNNFRIIGQGPGNNFVVHENDHITVNADGTVTSVHSNTTADCK